MNREELTRAITTLVTTSSVSNIKFFRILVSRLTELDIGYEDAILIASSVEFDFSNVPEDNDSLSEFATVYADVCLKIYKFIKLCGFDDISPLAKYFNVMPLSVDNL